MKSPGALALLLAVVLQACDGASADSLSTTSGGNARRAPQQIIAVIDFSGSRTPLEISKSQVFLESLVSQVSFGDRLVVLAAHSSGRRDSSFSWSDSMPSARNPAKPTPGDTKRLTNSQIAAKAAIEMAFAGSKERPHTDLVATLHAVANHLQDAPNKKPVLVLLSDMLNSTSTLDMERKAPPLSLVAEWASQGLIPKLSRSCVIVVGAEDDNSDALKVREFWTAYFKAAGASLSSGDYRYEASDAGSFQCFAESQS